MLDPPRRALLTQAMQLLGEEPGVERLRQREDEFSVAFTHDGGEQQLFLENLFVEVREYEPEAKTARLQSFIRGCFAGLEHESGWAEAAPLLRVVLRGALYGPPGADPVAREVLPCLHELVVVDLPQSLKFATRSDLEHWGIGADAAFERGRANVAAVASDGVTRLDDEIFSVDSEDSYETSRLLAPGFLASFAGRVAGQPIAIVPERSTMYVAGDAEPHSVTRLCEMAEREFAASPRRISAAVYSVGTSGEVVEYVRAVDDEAARRVRTARIRFHGTEYSHQKEQLDREFEARGRDIFVASFSGLAKKGPEVDTSYCTWGWGIDTLLPRTDVVMVALAPGEDPGVAMVTWSDLLQIGGDLLALEPDLFPPRWRIVGVLRPEQVARLAERSLLPR